MSEPSEREDLEALLASPGWHRLLSYGRQRWIAGYPQRCIEAVASAVVSGKSREAAFDGVSASQDAINDLLTWPLNRMKQLDGLEAQRTAQLQPVESRRGNL